MNNQTRKQREIAERHGLFLSIAQKMMDTDGYAMLSMDRIAEISEYSKGTVYQHFHCKEEVLIQLCNQCMTDLLDLFSRASTFEGNHRERILAVFFAHDLWARMQPKRFQMIQTLSAEGTKCKVDQDSLAYHNKLEASLIGAVSKIVGDAIADGNLTLEESLNPVELVFGLWSLSYGGQLIQTYDIPLQELGVRDAGAALTRMCTAVLDGLNWEPYSSEFDYQKTIQRVVDEIFAMECKQID